MNRLCEVQKDSSQENNYPTPFKDSMVARTIFLFVMILTALPLAFAQEVPKFDIFLGYSYLHTDLREHCCTSKGIHGGSVSIAYNVNSKMIILVTSINDNVSILFSFRIEIASREMSALIFLL